MKTKSTLRIVNGALLFLALALGVRAQIQIPVQTGFTYVGITSGAPSGCTTSQIAFFTDRSAGSQIATCASGTWTPAGGSGGTVSGQASGVIPLGTSANVIGNQSHCDDGVTTAGTVSCGEPLASTLLSGSGVSTSSLSSPATTTVTPTCSTACSSSYDYSVAAKDIYGNRTLRTTGATAAQNATLSSTNYNTVTWTAVTGAYSYDVYIITGGNSPGWIANVLATSTLSVKDTGLTVCYADTPLSNDTNKVNMSGNYFTDISINGALAGIGPGGCNQQNTRFGAAALGVNTTGYLDSAFGYEAMQSNTTGFYNTALGWEAMENNTTGNTNTAVGISALAVNIAGNYNTAVGANALLWATGSASTAMGSGACNQVSTGLCDGFGGGTFSTMTTGVNNVGVGEDSGQFQTGSYNTAIGNVAMKGTNGSSSGSNSTAVGDFALGALTSGHDETAVGFTAGDNVTTGIEGVYIGSGATAGAVGANNEIVIGYNATGGGTNSTTIGNSSTTSATMFGFANANTGAYVCYVAATHILQYDNTACAASLRALKMDIHPVTGILALSEVMKLKPVDFLWKPSYRNDTQRHVGFIAEDVEKVDSRIAAYNNEGKLEGVDYEHITAIDTAAIQALQQEVLGLEKEVSELKKELATH